MKYCLYVVHKLRHQQLYFKWVLYKHHVSGRLIIFTLQLLHTFKVLNSHQILKFQFDQLFRMATRTRRSKRGPTLTLSSVKAVATALFTSIVIEDLTESILKKLPSSLDYLERKKFLEIILEQCIRSLVSSLCQKYSTLYGSCHGKDGYLKFQINKVA